MPVTLDRWCAERVPTEVAHLDVAACGIVSRGALGAEVAHLYAEAELGGYAAQAAAAPVVDAGRDALARLLGLTGADTAFLDGAGTAFAALLAAWPLQRGARIGTVASEYGANARVLARLATERGWTLVPLEADDLGRVAAVPPGLDLLTLPHVASQRGVVQPVEQLRDSGVPLLLDVAQSLGQTDVPPGCAAYVGTSRKWLCGPRGVGFAVVAPEWEARLVDPPTLGAATETGIRRFEAQEAHIAGRVGLAVAVAQWSPVLLAPVQAAARAARELLAGAGGWQVVEPVDEPSGITTLRPPAGTDPAATAARLRRAGVVVSPVPSHRAAELTGPVLRVSTAAWVGTAMLERTAALLHG